MEILFRINELILLTYFISLSALSYDFFYRNRQVRKASFFLAVIGSILHFIVLIISGVNMERLPIQTTYESMYLLSLIVLIIGLLHFKKTDSEVILFIYLTMTFIFFSIYVFSPVEYNAITEVTVLMNELLAIHVFLVLTGYVLLFISALHAMIYLIQNYNLKRKNFNRTFFSLFSLESAHKVMIRTMVLALMCMFCGIALGLQWGLRIIGTDILVDFKVLSTIIIILSYIVMFGVFYRGNQIQFAQVNIILFVICMINYLFLNQFSDFHVWTN